MESQLRRPTEQVVATINRRQHLVFLGPAQRELFPLITRETVAMETPASLATSRIEGMSKPHIREVCKKQLHQIV